MTDLERLKHLRETLRKLRWGCESIGDYPGLVKLTRDALEDVSALMQEAEEREGERCAGVVYTIIGGAPCARSRGHYGSCRPF